MSPPPSHSGDDEHAADEGDDISPAIAEHFTLTVDEHGAGQRLDAFLAAAIDAVSRARIRRSIDDGQTTVDGKVHKASYRLAVGERIETSIAPAAAGPAPEPIALDILLEDDAIVVVNKPPGMVVHPAKGHWSGTLAAALVHRFGELSGVGGPARPGIVHRLDRDTSGVIVVAKTDAAHESLGRQFHDREVKKEYLALVAGHPDRDADRVTVPIGPHPSQREKMMLRVDGRASRPAETFFEVVERFPGFALMRAHPKTGRTHQIRLHLAHIRLPVVCDRLYGHRGRLTAGELRGVTRRPLAADLADAAVLLDRQALHAHRLSFAHPLSGERIEVEAPLPADMLRLLAILRQSA